MRKLGEEESEAEINVVERVIQISIIGDVAVGKTSLVNCFLDRKFELEVEPTRGIDMRFKKLIMGRHLVKLRIWDAPGDEMLQDIMEGYLKNSDGLLYVFQLGDPGTYYNVLNWKETLEQQKANRAQISSIMLGNKRDESINGELSATAKEYCKKQKLRYEETSAKDNKNVVESFTWLIRDIIGEAEGVTGMEGGGEWGSMQGGTSNVSCPSCRCWQ